jgi:pyridoxamine 5'-phosphate oxidase
MVDTQVGAGTQAGLDSARVDYRRGRLLESQADPNPILFFQAWLAEAIEAGMVEANAMALATATPDGRPSVRFVLMKGVDQRGITFFTNYESRKGVELTLNPWAAATFWWGPLHRQVRFEGSAAPIDEGESDAYFATRPFGSQLSTWVSAQSMVIPNWEMLQDRFSELEQQYTGQMPPRPANWGGYRLVPESIEFWQGGPNRLHDRLRYRRAESAWAIERLSP